MYLFFQILFSVLLAFIVGSFFYYVFKYTGPWGSFWTFVLVLILAGVAASVWIEPIGPIIYNIAFVPILVVILIFAFFLAAVTPPRYSRKYPLQENTPEPNEEELPVLAISTFFWVFLVALVMAALLGVFR
jgi:hypothetical protein